jgi:uncharacterized SAM-binding protein YcdF (DUF218 family)
MTYLQPLMLVFLIITFIGLMVMRRAKKTWLAVVGVVGLFLLSWPPVDWLLSRPLEARYPVRALPPEQVEAIVVVSSASSPPRKERPYALPDKHTYQRCVFAAWLYQHWRPVPVLACGGPGGKHSSQPVAMVMRQSLQQAGVPEAMIWTEERSGSTHENAVFGAEILRQHGIGRIALVIEARSMLRAESCFRKQGMTVVPAPCEFREFESPLDEFIPSWKAVSSNEETLHETAGLAWYWLRGWI